MESQVQGLSKTLAHFQFLRLDDELEGERMVTPCIQTCPRIMHIDRGGNEH